MSKMIKFISDNEKEMLSGGKNKAVRWYFYAQNGLNILNEFRYLVMCIMGAYYLLKIDNPMVMVIMFAISLPVLIIIGWFAVHYMSVVLEFLGIRYTTACGKYSFELQERKTEACEKLVNLLKEKQKKKC